MNTSAEQLAAIIRARLAAGGTYLLEQAGRLAEEQGQAVYLVGGAIRDLMLDSATWDLDLVVEGDGPSLAQKLVQRLGGAVTQRSQFGTVKFTWQNWVVDVATARSERYSRPGALPKVQPADISKDLGRRDFTVNTMAVRLNPRNWGQLLDPFNGRADLGQKLLRVLHDQSFQDDATRILRGLRYEQRLGFQLEPRTRELLQRDVGYLDTISGPRVWREIELILGEEGRAQILRRMEEVGALTAIHPHLPFNAEVEERLTQVRQWPQLSPTPIFLLGVLTYSLPQEVVESVVKRLRLAGEKAKVLRHLAHLRDRLSRLEHPDTSPSQLAVKLEGFHPQAIGVAAVCAQSPLVRTRLRRYLDEWRYVKTIMRGHDLHRLGIASGPQLGQALAALKAAKLDERVATRQQEEAFVREWLKEHSLKSSQP